MEILLIWLLGWLLFSIGYYIYQVYYEKDIYTKKRLIIYRGITIGWISWFGIIICLAVYITFLIFKLDEWITDKLE